MAKNISIIIGFHGTNSNNVNKIKKNNFKESASKNDWLGNGVYFFYEHIHLSPEKDAENWAILNAWEKPKGKPGRYKYLKYSVLRAKIKLNTEQLLDIDSDTGLKIFNYARESFLKDLETGKKKLGRNEYIDSAVINYIKENSKISFVKCKMSTKLSLYERIKKVHSRIPNVSILTVSLPKENIIQNTIKEIKKGEINHDEF